MSHSCFVWDAFRVGLTVIFFILLFSSLHVARFKSDNIEISITQNAFNYIVDFVNMLVCLCYVRTKLFSMRFFPFLSLLLFVLISWCFFYSLLQYSNCLLRRRLHVVDTKSERPRAVHCVFQCIKLISVCKMKLVFKLL